jgi:hypothetical protein
MIASVFGQLIGTLYLKTNICNSQRTCVHQVAYSCESAGARRELSVHSLRRRSVRKGNKVAEQESHLCPRDVTNSEKVHAASVTRARRLLIN